MALLRALRGRAYRFLWVGQTISSLGDWLYRIALVWWVMEKTGSGAALGTIAILSVVPQVVFLLVGGVIVDRLPRVLIMVTSDVVRGVLTVILTAAMVTNHVGLGLVYGVTLVFAFVDAFVSPAFNALLPEIVAAEDLASSNSLNALSSQLTGIVGPALGAVLVATGGSAIAFGIDAATFFASAVCLLAVRRLPTVVATPSTPTMSADDDLDDGLDGLMVTTVTIRGTGAEFMTMGRTEPVARPGDAPKPGLLAEMREGVAVVRKAPWLWVTMAAMNPARAIYAGLTNVSLPFLIKETLKLDVGSFSMVQIAAAIGAVIVAVVLGRRGRLRHRGPVLYLTVVVMGAGLVWMGLSTSIVGLVLASLLCNAAINASTLVWLESAQSMIPREVLGRVASIDIFLSMSMMPVGFFAAGWAADHTNPATAFVLGGVTVAALALIGLLHPRVRRFD